MKFLRFLLLAALPLSALAASSDPVGVLRLKLRGNSDTIVSLPLHRPTLVEGKLTARDGNALTLDAEIPALPPEGAFALVMTGALEGAVFDIRSTNEAILTTSSANFDLSALSVGDTIAVIPYWSLDTLFPAGRSVHPTTSLLSPKTRVLLFDSEFIGTNDSATASYLYFSGNSDAVAGWYRIGDWTAPSGSTALKPHSHFVVRNSTGDTDLVIAGSVQMSASRLLIRTPLANSKQDNRLALPTPLPVSLADSQLVTSGAFVPTTNLLSPKDVLLVFDNTAAGYNKAAVASYFYFSGTGSPANGWYRTGILSETADATILEPAAGFVIRKRATPSPETRTWNLLPLYLQ